MVQNAAPFFDFVIVGAGVIGVSLAIELKREFPAKSIAIFDKEDVLAFHASGRNSGVLHAGFYYTADSLKARFTAEGNRFLKDYCLTKKLKLNCCGKLVVATNEEELAQFSTLMSRARANDVVLDEISLVEAQKLEPRVISHRRALWSPSTATIDPGEVLHSLAESARGMGIKFFLGCAYIGALTNQKIRTTKGDYTYGYLINSAGLYADKIAHDFGFASAYRIIPFKGLYLYCDDLDSSPLQRHIYPVPNLNNPFLGVHHTITVDGRSKIGPTAIPALWREQYDGFSRFKLNELITIFGDEIGLFFSAGFDFRSLAIEELKKYYRPYLVSESARMATGIQSQRYKKWGRPGIRAQLFHVKERRLVMDFCFEGDRSSFHILNAISPAFTCSQPFAAYLVPKIVEKMNS